jgi:hypothetical protein
MCHLRESGFTHIVDVSVIRVCARNGTRVCCRSLEKLVTEGSRAIPEVGDDPADGCK